LADSGIRDGDHQVPGKRPERPAGRTGVDPWHHDRVGVLDRQLVTGVDRNGQEVLGLAVSGRAELEIVDPAMLLYLTST
jgi:hypothetical protein